MYPRYKSKFGYQIDDDQIDSYGVDHSGFSTRDEVAYQLARNEKENSLMQQHNNQSLAKHYPQYGTNFWSNNPDNNYGFGNSNITNNIENMNDIANQNPNHISDAELYKKMWNNIKEYEGVKYHPYLDTKGYITTGGGANINNLNDFMKVNFTVNGNPATDTQKLTGYNILRDLSEEQDASGNYINRNRTADSFRNDTNLQLPEQEAYNMAQNHMTNDLAHIRNQFSDFDSFPNPLKEVLLDIQYNTGGLNKQNWPNLYEAINNRDINGIARNVHRKDVGWERNDWAERMARLIRF